VVCWYGGNRPGAVTEDLQHSAQLGIGCLYLALTLGRKAFVFACLGHFFMKRVVSPAESYPKRAAKQHLPAGCKKAISFK
jgi:hypothetical protein